MLQNEHNKIETELVAQTVKNKKCLNCFSAIQNPSQERA